MILSQAMQKEVLLTSLPRAFMDDQRTLSH
jgi:hypothetical protein